MEASSGFGIGPPVPKKRQSVFPGDPTQVYGLCSVETITSKDY